MKLNKNGLTNLAVIIACVAVILLISAGISALYIFGIIGILAIYLGVQTLYYQEVPQMKDYSNVSNKKKFCFLTGFWMILMGIALIALCAAYLFGMDITWFWSGIIMTIILAAFFNFVVKRAFVTGFKSNLEKIIDLLKHSKK